MVTTGRLPHPMLRRHSRPLRASTVVLALASFSAWGMVAMWQSRVPPPELQGTRVAIGGSNGVLGRPRAMHGVSSGDISGLRARDVRANGWAGDIVRVAHKSDVSEGVLSLDIGNGPYISLASQGITEIPKGSFAGGEAVKTLELDNNKISSLEEGVFDGLSSLEELSLSGNILTTIHPNALQGCPRLKSLSLSRNPLAELPVGLFENLPNLTTLTLHSVPLPTLNPEVLKPLKNLRYLHMYNTGLKQVSPEIFSSLPNLQALSIHMSSIDSLPAGVFDNLPNLEELSVDGDALPLQQENLFKSQTKLRHVYLFGETTEDIFKQVRSGLADANNCKVVVQENPNIGPGYSFT